MHFCTTECSLQNVKVIPKSPSRTGYLSHNVVEWWLSTYLTALSDLWSVGVGSSREMPCSELATQPGDNDIASHVFLFGKSYVKFPYSMIQVVAKMRAVCYAVVFDAETNMASCQKTICFYYCTFVAFHPLGQSPKNIDKDQVQRLGCDKSLQIVIA